MSKRIVALLAVALIIALLPFAGCSRPKPADTGESTPTPNTPVAPSNDNAALLHKGAAVENLSFEGTLGSGPASYSVKGWIRGQKSRIERTIDDETTITIYDEASETALMWAKGQTTGMKGELPAMAFESPIFWAKTMADAPWKSSDRGEVNGIKCRIAGFAYGSIDQSVNLKLWIAEDTGLPIKMEANYGGIAMAFEYKNLSTAAPDAGLFVPPSDVKFVEVPK